MHWILQDNLFNEEAYQTLLDTLMRFNIPHSIHKVIPFVGELFPEPELDTKNVVCMGSYSLRHAAKKCGWKPGVFDLEEADFEVQKQHWGEHMLNYDSVVVKFKDAVLTEQEMFIRPIQDTKVFAGRVISKDEFEEWKRSVVQQKNDYGNGVGFEDTLIQVSPLKTIYTEYRLWVVDQKIVSCSLYKRGNQIIYSSNVDRHIFDFGNNILKTKNQLKDMTLTTFNKGWAPSRAFCLDVCETDQGMKVVEINTLNSSGFYACNIPDLVIRLETAFNERR